jgi:hypothetical protein
MSPEVRNRVDHIYSKREINYDDIDFMIQNNAIEYYKEKIRGEYGNNDQK